MVIHMIRQAPAMEVRQNLGDLLNEVHYRHDSILITKAGKPFAALVDIDLFKKMQYLKKEFDTLTKKLGSAYANVSKKQALKEIEDALKQIKK